MKTFGHAGDLGDIAWSLPAIHALGGGTLVLHSERWTREPMTEAKVESIRSLLITQPYINEVRWLKAGEKVDHNLNDFRSEYFSTFRHPDFPKQRNLCEWILRTHGVDPADQNRQWLTVDILLRPNTTHISPEGEVSTRFPRVIINRTSRYQNPAFPWMGVCERYFGDMAFVGSREEHKWFCRYFCQVPYVETPNLLTLAQVIAGADLFIGNQSLPYAIAEGLKKRAVLEVCPWLPNCLFHRPDVIHGWDANIQLPDL